MTHNESDDILRLDDLLTKTSIFKYKASHAFDKQSLYVNYYGYKGHDFTINNLTGLPMSFNEHQWKFLEENHTGGSLIIFGSPTEMLIIDDQGRMVGSKDTEIINEIAGAKYMPPNQIGYSSAGNPDTAFELDEFIFFPNDLIGNYELNIKGTGNGEYTLQFAQFDPATEVEYSDVTTFIYNIKEDEIHRYEISIDDSINPTRILTIDFDIKPGSCTNHINTKSKGVFSAAILGTEDLDVTSINPETILLGRDGIEDKVSPIRWSYEDSISVAESCDNNDINGDSYTDLIFKFDSQTLVNTLNLGEATGEIISLQLTGNLKDENVQIEGIDTVSVIK